MTGRLTTITTAAAAATALLAGALVAAPAATASTERSTTIVSCWYGSFLGRGLDQTLSDPGRSYWADRLDAGEAPAQVLDDLVHTREYAENQVEAYYSLYLGRTPDAGARVWVEGMTGDMEEEWVVQNLIASPDFGYPIETPGAYVGAVFEAVLGRRPAQGELPYWTDRYQRSGWDELSLVREVWYTPEAVGDRIEEHYFQRLGRASSAGEVDYWRAPEASSDLSTKVAIAASDEGVATALRLQQQ